MDMPTRATRSLLRLTAFVTIAILAIGGATLWQTTQTKASSDQIRESSAVTACRSELRVEIDVANSETNRLFLLGVQAIAEDDPVALDALIDSIPDALAASDAAVEGYAEGATLARTDPAAFLASCRKEPQP